MKTIEHTGRLCSVYCPNCGKVTDKISFNLLREAAQDAARVTVRCQCGGETYLEYDGKTVTVEHNDLEAEMSIERQRNFQTWWSRLSDAEKDSWLLTNGS
jgi:cell division septum initiation protein DivIVA